MRLVPEDKEGKISFYESRLASWAAHAAEMGVDPEHVAQLIAKTTAARERLLAQTAAQSAAQSATLALTLAIDEMANLGAAIVEQVRTAARQLGPGVYKPAMIPPRAKPSPIAAPGKPHTFRTKLGGDGSLSLTWKCKNPRESVSTIYQIHRRIGPTGTFAYLSTTGEKKFIDATLPEGSTAITYQVRAIRSTKKGPIAQFNVNFGLSPGEIRRTARSPFVAAGQCQPA